MKADVDVFCPCVIVVGGGEGEGCLIVTIERKRCDDNILVELANEFLEPDAFLCGMRGGDVFCFSCGQCDEFLLAGTPGNCASVDNKCEARDGSPMVLAGPVCISVPYQLVLLSPVRQRVSSRPS